MGAVLNPYLNFRGNAGEAMEFYRDVFAAKLNLATFADHHASSDPSEDHLIMHADLEGPEGSGSWAPMFRTGWSSRPAPTSRCH